jgi:hypothetical protein
MPPHGQARIDLHLGQKPKLGGRYADDTLIHIIFYWYFIYPCFAFFSLLFSFLFLLSKTQKDQIYFRCFSLFAFLVFLLWFALLVVAGAKLTWEYVVDVGAYSSLVPRFIDQEKSRQYDCR